MAVDEVLLVVVGAGASYDCKSQTPSDTAEVMPVAPDNESRPWREVRPPLTTDLVDADRLLFNRVLEKYQGAWPVVGELRQALSVKENAPTLEQALLEFRERARTNPYIEGQLRDFRCYLRDVLLMCSRYMLSPSVGGGITNYTHLVSRCMQWAHDVSGHVCFVSLNYDVLLETALESVTGSFSTVSLPTYYQDERYSLVKPHGSAAWQVDDRGQLEPVIAPERIRNMGFPPQLALPVMPKVDLLWPDLHRDHFRRTAARATRLLTVGWRAADDGIVSELAEHAAGRPVRTLGVVGPGDWHAQRAVKDFLESMRNLGSMPPLVDDDGFTGWLAKGRLEQVFLGP